MSMRPELSAPAIFDYIQAYRSNSLAPMIVKSTLTIGRHLDERLSYLGLGVEPHIPEWGIS